MAKLQPGTDELLGTIGNRIYYKRKDMGDEILARTKPRKVSKERRRNHPNYEPTRRVNREFGGRSGFSGAILETLQYMRPLCDYNIAGPLNALLKSAQELDKTGEPGKRSIELSRSPAILEGFPLNKRNVFESVVRSPLNFTISKEEMKAVIETPVLSPNMNFFPVDQYPVFRWQACLLSLPDMCYKEKKGYEQQGDQCAINYAGPWCSSADGAAAELIELSLPLNEVSNPCSLVLVVGISFGTIRSGGAESVKYAGAGKIVRAI